MKLATLLLFIIGSISISNIALADNHLVSDRSTIVDASTAKALHERGVPFIDVRSTVSYGNGHIPGAENIDVRSDSFVSEFTKSVGKEQEVVIYCRGPNCDRSPYAIQLLSPLGYEKLFYFKDGLPGWKSAGYEVEM